MLSYACSLKIRINAGRKSAQKDISRFDISRFGEFFREQEASPGALEVLTEYI
jgi:hypothetical protein